MSGDHSSVVEHWCLKPRALGLTFGDCHPSTDLLLSMWLKHSVLPVQYREGILSGCLGFGHSSVTEHWWFKLKPWVQLLATPGTFTFPICLPHNTKHFFLVSGSLIAPTYITSVWLIRSAISQQNILCSWWFCTTSAFNITRKGGWLILHTWMHPTYTKWQVSVWIYRYVRKYASRCYLLFLQYCYGYNCLVL